METVIVASVHYAERREVVEGVGPVVQSAGPAALAHPV